MERKLIKDLAKKLKEIGSVKSAKDGVSLITDLINVIKKEIKEGNEVYLTGFGKFFLVDVEEKQGRNPMTGEDLTIPAHSAPKFKYLKAFKDDVR